MPLTASRTERVSINFKLTMLLGEMAEVEPVSTYWPSHILPTPVSPATEERRSNSDDFGLCLRGKNWPILARRA
jgi:hypothetical protein